jgi:hypothetical protein
MSTADEQDVDGEWKQDVQGLALKGQPSPLLARSCSTLRVLVQSERIAGARAR